jgi:hypothetical protein
MKQGVIGASKQPRRKRQIAMPVKLLQAAVIMRIAPQAITKHEMTVPTGSRWAIRFAGYSQKR